MTIEAKGTGSTQTLDIAGASTTLSYLTPETTYDIRVAGVNIEGTGVSTNVSATTLAGSAMIVCSDNKIIARTNYSCQSNYD